MTRTLDDFCDRIMADDHPTARLEPEGLAAEFIRYFQVPLRVPLEDIAVLLECAGVGEVSEKPLAGGLRGVHYTQPDGSYAVHYQEGQWEGGKVHTVLHETGEIIHEQVWDRHRDSKPPNKICQEADRFAAAVMMPPGTFASYVQASGLDVAALCDQFSCSYASVCLRMAEVACRMPLMVLLYERVERGDPAQWPALSKLGDLRVTVMKRTADMATPRSRLLNGWRGGIPRKGKPLSAGSLAEQAARSGGPEYAEGDGIALVATPVLWKGRLSKVIVVAVPWEQRRALAPQLGRRRWRYPQGSSGPVPGFAVG